jgi:sugar phosphate permease
VFGLLGVVWAFFFGRWFRDRPADHPSVNAAERELLRDVSGQAGGHGDVPWKKLMSSRSVWLLWAQYFCMSFPWYFYITWLTRYLEKGRHLSEGEAARLAVLPLLFGGFGSLVCGWLAPRLARAMGACR